MSAVTLDAPPAAADVNKTLATATGLPPEAAERLLPYLEDLTLAAGAELWREGQTSAFAIFLLAGRIEEQKLTEFAENRFVVGVYGPGALLGESNLLGTLPCPLSASCLEESRCLKLSQERFAALRQEQPQLAMALLELANQTQAERLGKAFERLAAIF